MTTMKRNEAETRTQLIYPTLRDCGWPPEHIAEERNAGAIYKVGRKQRRGQARVDYLLQVKIGDFPKLHPVAVIEAKHEESDFKDSGSIYVAMRSSLHSFVVSTT
jgi:type I site-specific restriction endonuclease